MTLPTLPPAVQQALDTLYLAGPDAALTAQAQARLRAALAAAQVAPQTVPLAYTAIPETALGPLLIAASQQGLVALRFGDDEAKFVDELQQLGPVARAPQQLAEASQQLQEYLQGQRLTFELPVDLSALTPFQRTVLQAACQIPRGQVLTYGDLAQRIGRPHAARAVGQALRRNPIPIVVPCHRVLGSDGKLHGYLGQSGIQTKARLLQLEGAVWPH